MSKRINVNPDHYKGAGRERPGDGVADKASKQPTADRETQARWDRRQAEQRAQQKTADDGSGQEEEKG